MKADNSKLQLKPRTKQFAIRAIRLVEALPATRTADVIGRQLMRSALSVGSNYRSACRARSRADFVSKLGIAYKEARETSYWLRLLKDTDYLTEPEFLSIYADAEELCRIIASIQKSTKASPHANS